LAAAPRRATPARRCRARCLRGRGVPRESPPRSDPRHETIFRVSDRDLVGYGATPPDPPWPGGARLAVSFVLNYEEGGERSVLEGDPESESYLQEVVGAGPTVGRRNLNAESMFEFGQRVGVCE